VIYRKNLYSWEQLARVAAGLVMALGAIWTLPGALLGYALIAAGIGLALTGLFGFCPACAMIGRRPVGQQPVQDR